MIRGTIKAIVYLTAFGVLSWLFFFVPLGQRTMWQHVQRVAATEEAQEMGDEVGQASERVEHAVREKLKESVTDAGAH